MYVRLNEIKKYYGVSAATLRRWADSGKFDSIRTHGNHRLFRIPESRVSEETEVAPATTDKNVVVYIRVSSNKQKDDLERQQVYMLSHRPGSRVIRDIASGINWKRPGLLSLLDGAIDGTIGEVVVASRDRLSRIGFDIIEWMLRRHGCKVTVLQSIDQSPEEELSDDLLSIVQVFCCRRNEKRRYRTAGNKGAAKADQVAQYQIESDQRAKIDAQKV